MPVARPLVSSFSALLLFAAAALPAHAAAWQPTLRTVTYRLAGETPIALYRSIEARGPEVGGKRVIAHTRFALTWTRAYRPQPDSGCRLAVAVPHLTVKTTLPAAPPGLSPAVAARFARFAAGIRDHEAVHARAIVAMVERIAAFSTGLSAPADPACTKVRARLQDFLAETIAAHTAESVAFDKEDWGDGGHMKALVLAFVNGP